VSEHFGLLAVLREWRLERKGQAGIRDVIRDKGQGIRDKENLIDDR
jgi:hypothetical protein